MKHTKDNFELVTYYFDFEGKNSFTGVIKDKGGDIAYFLNGKLHRTDGPAVTYVNSYKAWFLNGECHREDGPAIEYASGHKQWSLNNKRYGYNDDYTNESWIRFVKLRLLK